MESFSAFPNLPMMQRLANGTSAFARSGHRDGYELNFKHNGLTRRYGRHARQKGREKAGTSCVLVLAKCDRDRNEKARSVPEGAGSDLQWR